MATAHRPLLVSLLAVVLGMVMLTYASVPLYRLFCQVTGFAGTTGQAIAAPEKSYDRVITVRFNADTDPSLPWDFAPNDRQIKVRVGQESLTSYRAHNRSAEPITGTAIYNVTPLTAGAYFSKIHCFCFDNQTLAAHQEVDMPVSFFISPEILNDPEMDKVDTITLSYTFFQVKKTNQ